MTDNIDVQVYFNFRCPYCYLASKSLFTIFDDFYARMVWRPLGGYHGRASAAQAKIKQRVSRQDVERHCRKMGIRFQPPPAGTDPTKAAILSLVAENEGVLQPYIQKVMQAAWANGADIGDVEVLLQVGEDVGLSRGDVLRGLEDEDLGVQLEQNWQTAQTDGVFGVPSFIIDDQIFWGNDRLNFLFDYLRELRLARS
ncbi:MAG: disulfide bond formation protein DsbA [Kordiimonas sp.]|nr:disulfide bond formation protein DsbA [Kordiimonas sp.]|tara:strand:+ start:4640 stop:5233 length:594 start_codon:yes stop_codon:yes gene_type:complete